jgi:hypothetical protein
MDLTRLLSLLGVCVPAVAVAGAIIAKEVLNLDPPETVYETIMRVPPEARSELLRKYTACNDIADEVEGFVNEVVDIVREYVIRASRGEVPDRRPFADRLRDVSRRIMDLWPRVADRFKPILPSGVFDVAYPLRLIDRIASTAAYLADLIASEPNPFEVERTAMSLLHSLKARVRDGYVECLRLTGLIKP